MRRINHTILGVLFALFILGAQAPPIPIVPHAGTQADPQTVYSTETCAIVFDDIYTANGVTISGVGAEVLSVPGVPVVYWIFSPAEWTLASGAFRLPIRARAADLPNGTYQVRARVWDDYGNVSEWSEATWAKKEWRTISRPGGCRIIP